MLSPREGQLIRHLLERGPLSNQELTGLLDVAPSTVTTAAGRLIDRGMVTVQEARHYDGEVGSGRRRKRTYRLKADYGFAVVVEIDVDLLVIHRIAFDLSSTGRRVATIETEDREALINRIDQEIRETVAESGSSPPLGIGFAMPGQVDSRRNVVIHNTRLEGWENAGFDRFAAVADTVIVENIANAVAWGERLRGPAQGEKDFLLLHIGNGAGMGIVIDGKLHRGENYAAGEAGHVIVEENSGITCSCGNRGCLESFVTRKAVLRELEKLRESRVPSELLADPGWTGGENVYRLLGKYDEMGDKVAYLVVEELAHKVGLAAANFAQIIAPSKILLSGSVVNLGRRFLDLVQQNLRRYHLPWLEPVPVSYGRDDHIAAAQGTAMLLLCRRLGF